MSWLASRTLQKVTTSGSCHLQRNAAFVGIKRQEEGAALRVGNPANEWRFVARRITAPRRFYFERSGALIGQ